MAGWGFTVVAGGDGDTENHATEVHSRCGHVVTDTSDACYIGAERPTNNTAELTAIACALQHVCADQSGRPILIRYDSLYAGRMATGAWRARKNHSLVARVRSLWAQAHRHLQGRLWASHVYGHTDHKWNDRADELARRKGGAPMGAPPANGRVVATEQMEMDVDNQDKEKRERAGQSLMAPSGTMVCSVRDRPTLW